MADHILSDLNEVGIATSMLTHSYSDCRFSPTVDYLIRSVWTVGKKEVWVGQLTTDEGDAMYAAVQAKELDPTMMKKIGFSDDEIEMIIARNS